MAGRWVGYNGGMRLILALVLLSLSIACSSASVETPADAGSCECGARVCGSVCGKLCGACEDDGVCSADGLSCRPALAIGAACKVDLDCGTGRVCLGGDHAPGGYCTRRCSASNSCPNGATCAPGADGESICLASCGSCRTSDGYACEEGSCSSCVGRCTGRTCGDDGCGRPCGLCETQGEVCDSGACGSPFAPSGRLLTPQGASDPRWDLAALGNANGQVFLVGGRKSLQDVDGTRHTTGVATVTLYDPVQKRFTAFGALPEPIARPHAAVVSDVVYVAGGIVDADTRGVADQPSSAFFKSDRLTWLRLNQAPIPQPSMGGAFEALGDKVYLLAGMVDGAPSNRVDLYDPKLDAWSPGPARPTNRGYFATATDGTRLYVLGGWDGSKSVATVEMFEPGSGWTTLRSLPHAVANAKALLNDGRVYLFGGYDGEASGDVTPLVQVLELATQRTLPIGRMTNDRIAPAPLRTRSGSLLLFGGAQLEFAAWQGQDEILSFRAPSP